MGSPCDRFNLLISVIMWIVDMQRNSSEIAVCSAWSNSCVKGQCVKVKDRLPILRKVHEIVERPCSVVTGGFDSYLCYLSGNVVVSPHPPKKCNFIA